MDVASDRLASAIFGGFADNSFVKEFTQIFKGAVVALADFAGKVDRFLSNSIVGGAWNWFKGWFRDDPVGATAGVLLGVVVLIVGGVAVAGAVGGLGALLKGLGAFGWVGKVAKLAFSAAAIGTAIRWVVRASGFIYNFNWNQSDEDIAKQQKALVDSLWGQAGENLGTMLGTLVCGAAPVEIAKRTGVIKTNPAILAKLRAISEGGLWGDDVPELYDEMMQSVKSLIQFGAQQLRTWMFLEGYKNVRRWIKMGAKHVGLKKVFPRLGKWIEEWGNREPWSLAIEVENRIERIKNPNWRTFAEEAIEAFMDSCSESLMIVSYAFA